VVLWNLLTGIWDGLVVLTWPVDCLACGVPVPRPGFCDACAGLVEARAGARCGRCDADLAPGRETGFCARCLARPPPSERAWGRFDYAGPAGQAIRAAKYRGRPDAVPVVARLLAEHLPDELRADPPGLVVPVPLHPRRVAERGVDLPRVIARAVARSLGVPAGRALRRTRYTSSQAGLDDRGRRRNVRGAFVARRSLEGCDVLLIDDVMTTGATLSEAARVAQRAGAARVRVAAVALVNRER
jgi:ComF family protein